MTTALTMALLACWLSAQEPLADPAAVRISAETIAAEWWTRDGELIDGVEGEKRLRFAVPDEGQDWPWQAAAVSPEGLLAGGKSYRIEVVYETEALPDSKSGFYLFVRSETLGYGVDRWLQWRGETGTRSAAELRVSLPAADDFRIYLGVHFSGTIAIDSITIEEGMPWETGTTAELTELPAPLPEPQGPEPFTIDAPRPAEAPVFCVADYGAVARESGGLPPDAPERNYRAFQATIDAAPQAGGAIVRVPRGTYDFPGRGSIVLHDLEDFLFDGGGSLFVFGSAQRPMAFDVQRLHRAELRDFRIDWDWEGHALAYYGRVTEVAADGTWFEIHFPDHPDLEAGAIRWRGMTVIDPQTGIYQPGYEIGAFEVQAVERTEPGRFRVVPQSPQPVRAGETYLVRNYVYDRFAVEMFDNVHLTLRDVTIHSFPGIGFHVNGDQQYWQLLDCRIDHPQGERRPITCTADGYHVSRSRGYSIIDGAQFGWCGDDGVNIHAKNSLGVRVLDSHTLIAENVLRWRNMYDAGDPIEFRNGDLSPAGFTGVLAEVEYDHQRREAKMRFEDPVPPDLPRDAILFNRRYDSSRFIIRNSRFFNNATRGMLIHAGDGLVENNLFEHNRHEAIRIETGWESRWGEGYTLENLVLRGNTIRYPNAYGPSGGAAVHMGVYLPSGITSYPVFREVLFEKNTVIGAPGPAFAISSFADVVFRANTVEGISPWASRDPHGGVIRASHGRGLYVADPHLPAGAEDGRPLRVQLVPSTVEGVVLGDEAGGRSAGARTAQRGRAERTDCIEGWRKEGDFR